jgi:hypothetical protein
LTPTRIRHSEFLGVFASKSGDTNSDSLDTDPCSVEVESVCSGTRIRPSDFLFFGTLCKDTNPQSGYPNCRRIRQSQEIRIRISSRRIRIEGDTDLSF